MDKLYRTEYDGLSIAEKEFILKDIADKHKGFIIKSFIEFERFGQSTYTAVYEYEGCEFVFVPGDRVMLGWDDFFVGMDDETCEDILESLDEYGITDLHGYLKENMSPVRTVEISPMLVERELNEIGWRPIEIDDPRWKDNNNFKKALDHMQDNPSAKGYILNNSFKVSRINGCLKAFLFDSFSYDEFIEIVLSTGFRIPTEDEWEYLCGGGLRTLYRWGDSFNYDMLLKHFEEAQPDKTEYDLKMPNQFGIEIAYDPYKQEIVMDSQYFVKGGDGGCLICGGMGMAAGYIPTATYFRDINCVDDPLGYKECIGGDYTFFRRIIRL